ncbi:MAG: helix-turn-helix transcriptional regulator [Myxococcales bacterium]|nr:helix-turn-helix transcriptional regulator [Myxococcales bacterium]MCB9549974.1 helix-turn-helix transcriptional regulator [Myxococcales bacterium]
MANSTTVQPTTTWRAILGAVLADLRREAGRQQADVAAACGLQQAAWSKLERGATAASVEVMVLAAEALGTTPSAVLARAEAVTALAEARGVLVERRGANASAMGLLGAQALAALVAAAGEAHTP